MRKFSLLLLVACGAAPEENTDGGPVANGAFGAISGTRLKVRFLQGDDGSKQFLGWRDSLRNESCTFTVAEDGASRCLPIDQSTAFIQHTSHLYLDDACAQAIAEVPLNCNSTKYAIEALPQCPSASAIYKTQGDPFAMQSIFAQSAQGDCLPYSLSSNPVILLSDKIDSSEFVRSLEAAEQ